MKRTAAALIGLAALGAAGLAVAQNTFPTQQPGISAPGAVEMCLDANGVARACDPLVPRNVFVVNPQPTPLLVPAGARAVVGVATGSTGAVVGTLPAAGAKTTYLCGFDVSAIGGTATIGPITIANLSGATFTYQLASTASGNILSRTFSPCIPATTPGLAITITTTADGTATGVDVNAWGFQL